MDYEPLENQLVKVPVEPIIVQEDFHFAKEIIPDQIYDFNIGEQHFRQLLRKQRGDHKVIVVDHYHLYHYVVCVDSDRKKWTYSEEVVSEEWTDVGETGGIWRRVVKRQYFQPNSHDLDSYLEYQLIVRIVRLMFQNRCFEIIIPRYNNESDLFEPGINFLLKLNASYDFNFPPHCTFVVKDLFEFSKELSEEN